MSNETQGRLTLDDLRHQVDDGYVDTVLVTFPDMQGRLMGKRLTAGFFLDHVAEEGSHACSYLLGTDVEMNTLPGFKITSWRTGYHDVRVRPDFNTLRLVPWLEKTAIVLGDVFTDDGEIVPEAPRAILKRQVERLAALGYTAQVASELEFYLFKETFESAREKQYHDLRTYGSYIADYHILQTTKEEGILRQIRNQMNAAGVPVEGSKGEWGFGQEDHPESASLTANPARTSWASAIPPTTSQTCERPISNPIPSPSPVRSSSRTRLTAVKPMPSASERWTIRPFALPTSRPIASASPLLSCPVATPNATTPMATRLETATVLRIRRLLTGIV